MGMKRAGLALLAVFGAAAAILAGCAEPPPPPPPPPPPVALSPRIIEEASAYRAYMRQAAAISPVFTDGASVASSVRASASYEPGQFLRGAIAYAAIVALQDPAYVAGVRAYASDAATRQKVVYEIYKDPAYVVAIAGADSAAGRIAAALGDDGHKVFATGKAVKQAAYDVQRSKWSLAEVPGRAARLEQAKTLSATPIAGDMNETMLLQQASNGGPALTLPTFTAKAPPYTNLAIRGMAVAALAALGAADDASYDSARQMLADPSGERCLRMAKLNLYQCLAVSKPHYEDVFCVGQHGLMDTGQCVITGAGAAPVLNVVPPPLEVAQTKAAATPVGAAKVTTRKK
ncbi:MAG: hypothetical protein IT546_05295 [Caulobacteraceae bacterium]|nr:hypothetical protein [Caulobacteraceae bacterium]